MGGCYENGSPAEVETRLIRSDYPICGLILALLLPKICFWLSHSEVKKEKGGKAWSQRERTVKTSESTHRKNWLLPAELGGILAPRLI